MKVVVLGAGPAGLSASLLLARAGHSVTLLERDPLDAQDRDGTWDRPRKGVPHYRQPHAFTPRTRLEMRRHLVDVYRSILDAGADELDLRRKVPGATVPEDEELQYTAVRRPLIEWALLEAMLHQPGIEVRSPVRVTGLLGNADRVIGARTQNGEVEADLVVDALGRSSPMPKWLADIGAPAVQEETVDAGIIYYTRYYRIRDGVTLPDGPWIPTPRGDLGYAGYSTFPGDNRTFGAIFAIPPKDKALKILYDERAFEAAARLVPAMWAWCNPDAAEPITGMYAMANIDNMLRHYPSSPVAGLIPIGDAWCHTDPVFALGLSMAIMESAALARAVSEHPNDLRDVAAEYFAACVPEVYERYPWVVAFDEARNRAWEGEPLDPGRRDGANYALFGVGAAMAVALVDPEVFRVAVRRNTFLDRLAVLDDDAALQEQIEKNFAEMRGRRPPPVSRDELLDAAARATR